MIAEIEHNGKRYEVDLDKPIDISIPLRAEDDNPKAWYVDKPTITPVQGDSFVGSVEKGGSVNFRDITFNPHGHGTHTECVGHISSEVFSINRHLKKFFVIAKVITIEPEILGNDEGEHRKKGDRVITRHQVEKVFNGDKFEAVIIRTLPNDASKLIRQYSSTNFPYMNENAAAILKEHDIKHLLIDLPSIDREEDGGKLLAHHAFWNYPEHARMDATITEFIYVKDDIEDGTYLLNIQIAPFVNDATPSKPILYAMQ
ncbi:MAG: cyclase family protein [Flavobacteriales bacterium]|nr:cyclase family protein [Flavobacteriales bacterium]